MPVRRRDHARGPPRPGTRRRGAPLGQPAPTVGGRGSGPGQNLPSSRGDSCRVPNRPKSSRNSSRPVPSGAEHARSRSRAAPLTPACSLPSSRSSRAPARPATRSTGISASLKLPMRLDRGVLHGHLVAFSVDHPTDAAWSRRRRRSLPRYPPPPRWSPQPTRVGFRSFHVYLIGFAAPGLRYSSGTRLPT